MLTNAKVLTFLDTLYSELVFIISTLDELKPFFMNIIEALFNFCSKFSLVDTFLHFELKLSINVESIINTHVSLSFSIGFHIKL
jgi:hypothetical protein